MKPLVSLLTWLLVVPPNLALWISVRNMLLDFPRLLMDPQTHAFRPIDPCFHYGFESCLQLADLSITRLIWLRARQMYNLPKAAPPDPFRYLPTHRLSTTEDFVFRAVCLLERLVRIEQQAARLARRFALLSDPAPATPSSDSAAQSRAIAHPQFPEFKTAGANLHQTGPPIARSLPITFQ